MSKRSRRLRDFFNQMPNRDRKSTPREIISSLREAGELIDEIAATHELDLEGFARELNQGHRRLWHTVEDEIEEESKRRD